MSDTYEIVFCWPHSEASNVLVIGNFDSWDPSKGHRLEKVDHGFEGKVQVPWGFKVLYKFMVDGQWSLLENHPTEVDPVGNVNNVYEVPPKPEAHEMATSTTSDVIGPPTAKSTSEAAATAAKGFAIAAKDAVVSVAAPVVASVTETVTSIVNGNGYADALPEEKEVVSDEVIMGTLDAPENASAPEVVVEDTKEVVELPVVTDETIPTPVETTPTLNVVEQTAASSGPAVIEQTTKADDVDVVPTVVTAETTTAPVETAPAVDVVEDTTAVSGPPVIEETTIVEEVVPSEASVVIEEVSTMLPVKEEEARVEETSTTLPQIPIQEDIKVEETSTAVPEIPIKEEETRIEETQVPVVQEVPAQQPEPMLVEPAFSQPEILEPTEKEVVKEEPVEEAKTVEDTTAVTAPEVTVSFLPVSDATTNGMSDNEPKAAEVTESQPSEEPSTHTPAVSVEVTTEQQSWTIPPAVAGSEVILDAPILPTTVAAPPEKVEEKALETVAVSKEAGDVSTAAPEIDVKFPSEKEEEAKKTADAPTIDTAAASPTTNGASTPAPPTPMKQRFPSGSGIEDGTGSVYSAKSGSQSGTPRKKKLSIFGKIKEVFHGAEDKLLHHNRKASSSTTATK